MRKKNKKMIFFLILIFFVLSIWLIPNIIVLIMQNKSDYTLSKKSNKMIYNIFDLHEFFSENLDESSDIKISDNVIYKKEVQINTNINDTKENSYYFEIYLNQQTEPQKYNISSETQEFNIPLELDNEGENNITIKLYKNDEMIKKCQEKIYYIKKYEKQFLDELTNVCIGVRPQYMGDLTKSINLLKSSGINQVRVDAMLTSIYKDGEANIDNTNNWVSQFSNNGIEIELILNTDEKSNLFGTDGKISSEEEKDEIVRMINDIIDRYPQINKYEILNEPNFYYTTEEDMCWYSKVVQEVYNLLETKNKDSELIVGSTAIIENGNVDSIPFLEGITKYGAYNNSNTYSIHFYDFSDSGNNSIFKNRIISHKEFVANVGGFQKINISEYGIPTIERIADNTKQAEKLVQQSNILKEYNIQDSSIYTLIDTGEDINRQEDNYGIINYDYTPKLAYYALRNYFENTNGSQYIGKINLINGLETHVYDKDGKAKIIAWAENSDSTINIDYTGFTAKDLYGNEIENTDGKLEITTSPVYLDNISTKYFYEAISNTALEKYTEFEEKFGTEISSVDGLQERIDSLKQYMGSIYDVSSESEEIAKEKMKEHFDLGNLILEAYKNGSLDVEYVKLSSMIDMLNDIGDSYEDLVTVSSVTRNPDLQGTKTLIDNTEQEINNNSDIEIVYPTKILEFSKDLYEKADYINNLEEENDIKTGLIVSYDLHAKYLADWANTFANIYIDDYIENNPITESYSETNLTNKDVTVTLNIGEDTKITNNDGSNIYTFKDNGTFKFEYDRRGRTFSKEVKVENIDKTSPVISDVQNGTTYSNSVTPLIGDEHLKDVQLKLNGQVVKEYLLGNEIKEEGKYELVAKDWAGNETKVEFEIKYELEPESEEYTFDGQYIIGVNQNTALEKFIEILNGNVEYDVYRDDKLLENVEIVATGDRVVTKNGETYYIIVKGDVTKDGKTNIKDIVQMRRNILKLEEFDEYQKVAVDLAKDNVINIKDLVIIRRIILGLEI